MSYGFRFFTKPEVEHIRQIMLGNTRMTYDGSEELSEEKLADVKKKILTIPVICYYVPNRVQHEFHVSDKTNRAIFSGNRLGKTTCSTVEACWHLMGDYPKWYPAKLRRTPPVTGLVVTHDFKYIQKVTMPAFKKWMPKIAIKKWIREQGGIIGIELNNGSMCDFMSTEQDAEKFEGKKWHFSIFDEPMPRDYWVAVKRGLVDYDGFTMVVMTPISQAWLKDAVEEGLKLGSWACFEGSIYDNSETAGGYLKGTAIKEFEDTLQPWERQARLFGQFSFLSGLRYKNFADRDSKWCNTCKARLPLGIEKCPTCQNKDLPEFTNVVPRRQLPANWPRYCAIDPHPRKEIAFLMVAVDPEGKLWLEHEIYSHELIEDFCKKIKALTVGKRIVWTLIDPIAVTEDISTGINWLDMFRRSGVNCIEASKNREQGLSMVEGLLMPKKEADGRWRPGLYIFNDLQRTQYEFTHICWDDWTTSKAKDTKDEKQRTQKKYDDMLENLYRIVVKEPRYVEDHEWGNFQFENEYEDQGLITSEQLEKLGICLMKAE